MNLLSDYQEKIFDLLLKLKNKKAILFPDEIIFFISATKDIMTLKYYKKLLFFFNLE